MVTAVASAPGWSSTGGPWVKPEDAMKKLTWRTVEVSGPGPFAARLPEVYDTPGKFQDLRYGGNVAPWSKYVATVAVRIPDAEMGMEEMGARVLSSGGKVSVGQLTDGSYCEEAEIPEGEGGRSWIQYSFDKEITVRAITLGGCRIREQYYAVPPGYYDFLEASDDGRVASSPAFRPQG